MERARHSGARRCWVSTQPKSWGNGSRRRDGRRRPQRHHRRCPWTGCECWTSPRCGLDRMERASWLTNAALTYLIPVAEFPVSRWLRSTAVNFHGPFYMSQLCLQKCMLERRSGAIVNVSSGAAIGPGRGPYQDAAQGGFSLYGAEKAALERFHARLGAGGLRARCERHLLQPLTDRPDARRGLPQADGGSRPRRGRERGDDGAGGAAAGQRASRQGDGTGYLQPAGSCWSSAGSKKGGASASTRRARGTPRSSGAAPVRVPPHDLVIVVSVALRELERLRCGFDEIPHQADRLIVRDATTAT